MVNNRSLGGRVKLSALSAGLCALLLFVMLVPVPSWGGGGGKASTQNPDG